MSGRLIRFPPVGAVTEIPVTSKTPGFEQLHAALGGYLERIRVRWEGKIRDAYVDEDGIMKGLPINYKIHGFLDGVFKNYPAHIYGDVLIWVPDPKKVAKSS